MLQRDGHPTALGEALAAYGRIFKSLRILACIDADETYRRDIKHIRNLQEGRHDLARTICHGKKGELFHRYERGLENQLGVLGLVLNCVVLWTTVYLNAAIIQLTAQGYPVCEEDAARLSPFVRKHLGCTGPTRSPCPTWSPAPYASSAIPTPPMMMRSDVLPGPARARRGPANEEKRTMCRVPRSRGQPSSPSPEGTGSLSASSAPRIEAKRPLCFRTVVGVISRPAGSLTPMAEWLLPAGRHLAKLPATG